MPAPATIDEFIEIIGKSGVAETAKVKAYVQSLHQAGHSISRPEKLGEAMVRDGILTFFQAEQLIQGKWKRFFIGKYKVLERIGAGGMGQVFLCEHKLMKRRVALKVLPAQKAQDPASLERFYREARVVAALDHPNIVRAYDIDQDENIHFLVMEYVDGPNLQDLVKKIGPMDPIRAAHYVYGAAVGMHHAHEMGILHRDIKPGNVLVDRSGVVKLLDMGLARFFNDEDDLLTKKYDENILGTADYLSPEQAVDSHNVDIRADIYSLGGTFYFMLTGHSPFPEGTIAQKLLWHQTRDPKPIRSIRPEVPQALVTVLETMLKKKMEDRYQTPLELMHALAPFVQFPIDPPQEFELPSISAAASAPNFQPPRTTNGSLKSSTMGTLPNVNLGTKSSGQFAFGPAPAPPTATATLAPPIDGWAKLTADTQPKGLNDTLRHPHPQTQPTADRDRIAMSKPKSRLGLGLVLGVVLTAAIASGFSWLMKHMPRIDLGTPKIFVTRGDRSPDANRTHPTLRAALAVAQPGTTIVLLDDTLDEPPIPTLGSKSKDGLTDCIIESGSPSRTTTWKVSAISPTASSALEFQGLSGLTLSGLTIDYNRHCRFGVSILGLCPGLTLKNVTIKNCEMAGLRIDNAGGDPAKPIRLDGVRVMATSDKPLMAGILITASPTTPNKSIQIANGRFDGPGTDGVRIAGPLHDVEIVNNRFGVWQNGLTFSSGMPAEATCKLTLASNTFFQFEHGIRCDAPMPRTVKGDVVIRQNLFVTGQTVSQGPSGAIVGLSASDNARDPSTAPGKGIEIPTEVVAGQLPIDPANDATYLKVPQDSPFSSVGPKQLPVGAKD